MTKSEMRNEKIRHCLLELKMSRPEVIDLLVEEEGLSPSSARTIVYSQFPGKQYSLRNVSKQLAKELATKTD